jgi:hypothetical protein
MFLSSAAGTIQGNSRERDLDEKIGEQHSFACACVTSVLSDSLHHGSFRAKTREKPAALI